MSPKFTRCFLAGLTLLTLAAPRTIATAPLNHSTTVDPPILRVYLLAGQSNMEGHGVVDLDGVKDYNGGRGNLAQFVADPANQKQWGDLRRADGVWTTRDDVFVSYLTENATKKTGPLSVGYAVYDDRHHFGPELGIGRALGAHFQEPILLIKTAWGGKSLAKDFRPPSAGGQTGPYYTQMISEFRTALANCAKDFPALANLTPRIEGVIWFQGWNDGCDKDAAMQYEANLVHLIADVRRELGDATLPFIVGETGNMDDNDGSPGKALRTAQRVACERKDAAPNACFVATRQFLRKPADSPNPGHGHHWFGNGESYLLIGDALGRAMIDRVDTRVKSSAAAPRILTDFSASTVAKEWTTVNDGVMGGKSKGGPAFTDGILVFSGSTNTDGGGFSSIRSVGKKWDVGAFTGFQLRVRGDGRTYKFDTRMQGADGQRGVAYRADFATVANQWTEVRVPFSDFKPSWRGSDLEGRVPKFDASKLAGIGLMIYDGQDGPFRLEVDSIGVYRVATE